MAGYTREFLVDAFAHRYESLGEMVVIKQTLLAETPTGEFENPVTGVLEPTYRMSNLGNRQCNYEARQLVQNRINNGFRLFGVYYQALWD